MYKESKASDLLRNADLNIKDEIIMWSFLSDMFCYCFYSIYACDHRLVLDGVDNDVS